VTGPATYSEASEIPFPDVVNRYQALNYRDAMARAIATLQARGQWNDDRSLNPEDYPALTAAEHLELIALGEVMARHYRHPAQVHHAVLAGATWDQIAVATGGGADQARRAYGQWAEGQHRLRQDFPRGTLGVGDEEYAAAVKAAGAAGAGQCPSDAELNARRTAAAAVLDDYKAALASAPLSSPPGREWMLRLASVLEDLLTAFGDRDRRRPS
jgi:hypothetical protein